MITFKLWHRLFLATGLAVLAGVALMLWVQQLTFRRGLVDFLGERDRAQAEQAVEILVGEYRLFGWQRLLAQPRLLHSLIEPESVPPSPPPPPSTPSDTRPQPPAGPPRGPPPARPGPPPGGAPHRYALLDVDGTLLLGPLPPRDSRILPIIVDGHRVGMLAQIPKPQPEDDLEQAFAQTQWRNGMFSAAGILLLLLPASWWYARRLATPLSQMAARARQISAGDYAGRVALARGDEIGSLASDLDAMAGALEQNRQARQRWTAEISHELRTPVAIMRAEIEAIEDGLRPLDAAAVQSLGAEVQRLSGLIEDLYQLARADAGSLDYRMQPCDLVALIHDALTAHTAAIEAADLQLQLDLPARADLLADPQRVHQLIGNLLTNCIRYTDGGGCIRITLRALDGVWDWTVEDSAPGVSAADLPRLFDSLFRADASRSRAHGGAGLGLAIVQRIAQAHGATVSADAGTLGGLCIRLRWPRR